jgi:chemotaxis protein MotB
LAGCVSRDKYDAAVQDLQRTRAEATDLGQRASALEGKLAELSVDMQRRDARLSEKALAEADLTRKVDDMVLLNAELSERLKNAGQSAEQLANERGSLSDALRDMRVKLAELTRQQAAAEARAAEFRELLKSFQKMVDAGKLNVRIRRGRMLLELPNDVLFDSGKTQLKPVGKATIGEVARVLGSLPERSYQVAGHTDDVQINSARFASNWELSTARAVEVTKLLIRNGMDPKRLSAAGYGEWDPAADNTNAEGRAKNRRIEISLVPNLNEMVKSPGVPETWEPAPGAPAPR